MRKLLDLIESKDPEMEMERLAAILWVALGAAFCLLIGFVIWSLVF